MSGMIAAVQPMRASTSLSLRDSRQTLFFVTAFRVAAFMTIFALIFVAMSGHLNSLEFGLTLVGISSARLLAYFISPDKSRYKKAVTVVYDLSLLIAGALGASHVLGFSQTVIISTIWVALPMALCFTGTVLLTLVSLALVLLADNASSQDREEDFDVFTWSVQQTNEDRAELRKRNNAASITAGKEFIDTHIRAAITTPEDRDGFNEADAGVMQFIFSKAIFEYSMGSLKEVTELPSFFHSAENYVAEEITRLRDVHRAGIIIPDQLSVCFRDYQHFKNRDTYLTDHTAQTLMNDIIQVPLLWQKSMLIGDCYQASLATPLESTEEDG